MFYTNDPYFQVTERVIPLPGLESEVQLFHMSDLHLIVTDENSTEEWKAFADKQRAAWQGVRLSFAKLYGDACDEPHLIRPEEAWPKYISLVNEKKPHGLLMTGDMLNDFSTETIHFLGEGVKNVNVPWMWVRGNHEVGNDEAYLPYTGEEPVQVLRFGNLTLLGINNSRKKISRELGEVVKALATKESAAGNIPVLAMHIPIKTAYNTAETAIFDPYFLLGGDDVDEESAEFLAYLQEETCPIAAILCGHVHGHHVSEYAPGKKQICCSSAMVGACALLRFIPA
ncbi:MAG: metallophosphoesterase [Ruminococcaceae bacterium]|nr:metallophosphoesterase [Oscillospiraceae bacterium]